MIKRTIEISARGLLLRSRERQLVISRDDEVLSRIPFEDLGVLILAGDGSLISSGALRSAVEAGSAVIVCGEGFLPKGVLLPLATNSLHSERLRSQVAASAPLRKQLWMRVVCAKIRNQAALLPDDCAGRRSLARMAEDVRSGDSGNLEAQAGRVYWANVFREYDSVEVFRRRRHGDPPNGLLNYGYAVMRAAVARALCAAGLHPALGIHHSNRYNAFCLADDLIEPFRPVVDAAVLELISWDELEVTRDSKQRLLEVLTDPVEIGGERSPAFVAAEKMAQSLAECFDVAGDDRKRKGRSARDLAKILALPSMDFAPTESGMNVQAASPDLPQGQEDR